MTDDPVTGSAAPIAFDCPITGCDWGCSTGRIPDTEADDCLALSIGLVERLRGSHDAKHSWERL
jgi:hypothetical protein